jgi:hypothetical protein
MRLRAERERVFVKIFCHSPYFDGWSCRRAIVRLLPWSPVLCCRKQTRARVCVSYKQRDTERCQVGVSNFGCVCAHACVVCHERERARARKEER